MDKVFKVFDAEIKGLNREARTFTAIASTEAEDRDGDIIRANGWKLKKFKRNPVVLWAHDHKALPIAKAADIAIDGTRLKFTPQFPAEGKHAFADTVFELYADGFLKAFSVGFMPQEWVDRERDEGNGAKGYEYLKTELLEISAVPVPSNPEALALIRAKGIEIPDECVLQEIEPEEPKDIEDGEADNLDKRFEAIYTELDALADRVDALDSATASEPETKSEPQPPAPSRDEMLREAVRGIRTMIAEEIAIAQGKLLPEDIAR